TENHWGPSQIPANVVKLIETIDGLGLLFDTHNWQPELQQEGWERCAKHAAATHVKTFSFDERGNEESVDLSEAFRLLKESNFAGCWGVESVPKDGDEIAGARQTIALIRREVASG
ncbi:unnamed protein product, partial [marine sediment metagenome]